MKRVGYFGGTFDPPHRGHLDPVRFALEAVQLDAVVFVPAGVPPHKLGEPVTPFGHRFAMTVLATLSESRFFVTDLEAGLGGPTFTIDSVPLLRQQWPAEQTFFIMGSDSFAQITTWHRWAELVDLIHLVVLHRKGDWGPSMIASVPSWLVERMVWARPGAHLDLPESAGRRIVMVEHPPVVVGATELRHRLRHNERVDELVPEPVLNYASKYQLYRQGV